MEIQAAHSPWGGDRHEEDPHPSEEETPTSRLSVLQFSVTLFSPRRRSALVFCLCDSFNLFVLVSLQDPLLITLQISGGPAPPRDPLMALKPAGPAAVAEPGHRTPLSLNLRLRPLSAAQISIVIGFSPQYQQ